VHRAADDAGLVDGELQLARRARVARARFDGERAEGEPLFVFAGRFFLRRVDGRQLGG
jgi:hypothetical protein